ncbi:MAG: SDR family NAD(P)-dependent oxidoreductase [Spirulinaceae cyanobacterium]
MKHAFVIGASQGIGLEFVRQLLNHPEVELVFATYRNKETATGLLNLATQFPQKLLTFSLDITQEDEIEKTVRQIQEKVKELHFVINCVGILHEGDLQPEKSLRQINAQQLLRYFEVNSIGTALLAKHLMPLFRHRDRAIFATISAKIGSIGDNRLGGWYGYRASKAALNMFIRTTAIEYSRRCPKTIVVALHPGTTNTKLSQPFQKNVPPEKLFSPEKTVSQLLTVIQNLVPEHSGEFFSWDGSFLPW